MKYGDKLTFSVREIGKHGEGVVFYENIPVFVDGSLPGETVTALVTHIKSSYAKARLVTIEKPHEDRVVPPCARAKDCGGCQIMHLSYEGQLQEKTRLVKRALSTIAGFTSDTQVKECLASPMSFHYRNKIQLPVGRNLDGIVTGFFRRGSHEIVPYEHCLVHHESMEKTVKAMQSLLNGSSVVPYDEQTQTGTLRHFVVRANSKHEQLVGLVTTGKQPGDVEKLATHIIAQIPNVIGVVENINTKPHNAILGETTNLLVGCSWLVEEINGLQFEISLPSFFQVNLATAQILYNTALDFASLSSESRVLDAYCGIGTLTLMAAQKAKAVIGAECVEPAVLNARANARRNQIVNAEFVVARVEERPDLFNAIDVAFINPPRTGVLPPVIQALNDFGPERLVYISCNPETLARDAHLLSRYQLKIVQPVDMFPQTMHVESVALFERKIL